MCKVCVKIRNILLQSHEAKASKEMLLFVTVSICAALLLLKIRNILEQNDGALNDTYFFKTLFRS